MAIHSCAIEQTEYTTNFFIELLRRVLSFLNESLVRQGEVIAVVSIGGTHGETIGPGAKLEVETIGDGLLSMMASTPVAHYDSIVAPVLLQDLVQEDMIVAIVLVFIQIVGAHDAPSTSLGNGCLEGGQIDFVQSTIGDGNIHLMAILLIIVKSIVLDASRNALGLKALNIRHHHARGQPGIFAHILEVTTTQRGAIDIDARTQNHGFATIEGFLAKALAIETGHLRIPSGSQTSEGWECHTRIVGLTSLFPLVPTYIGTYAMRTIIRPHIGESQALHTRAGELRLGMNHGYLFFERHTTECIVDTLLYWLTFVEIDRYVLSHNLAQTHTCYDCY